MNEALRVSAMPHYLVEQTFAEQIDISVNEADAGGAAALLGNIACDGVTWLHSYISIDRRRMCCLCAAPTLEAVRRVAQRRGLPVDLITEVWVLRL